MVRPCVARGSSNWRMCGLASMYPASDWSDCTPGHHGYQRTRDLITGQASIGPFGSPVFACAGKTDPPSRLNLSQTSAGVRATSSIRSLSCAVPLLVPVGRRSSVPACVCADAPRAGARPDHPQMSAELTCAWRGRRSQDDPNRNFEPKRLGCSHATARSAWLLATVLPMGVEQRFDSSNC
jgi:hypothetical protein